jgi:toxin-antitoxin system PIN domain toxin
MIFLPDVNVWLALASQRHAHSVRCGKWLDTVTTDGAVFCRVTQMGLLRLLTNATVMGSDVLTSRNAWRAFRSILADERIGFAPEPLALEDHWRKLTSLDRPAPKLWTDAYLSAFARAAGLRLTTLDRAILAIAPDALLLK